MTEMTARQETFMKLPELRVLEERIHAHLSCAYTQIVEVGRCLNAAKERRLVPYGHWAEWLADVAGMNERQAQQWMRIAREVPEDSALAALEYSKIRAIMALPDPEEREEVAKAAKEQDMTVRELEKKVRDLQKQRESAVKAASEEALKRRQLTDEAKRNIETLQSEIERLKNQPAETGISPEAQAEIDRLKAQLESAQTFGMVQSEKRQEAQRKLLDLQHQMQNAGPASAGFSGDDCLAAARTFAATCGAVPHMGAEFAGMDAAQRRQFEQALSIMEAWCRGAHEALNTIVVR